MFFVYERIIWNANIEYFVHVASQDFYHFYICSELCIKIYIFFFRVAVDIMHILRIDKCVY